MEKYHYRYNMTNGYTLKYRVEQLEKGFEKLDEKVDSIMTNHLPHLQEEMSAIKTRQTINLALNAGAIILVTILGVLSKYL